VTQPSPGKTNHSSPVWQAGGLVKVTSQFKSGICCLPIIEYGKVRNYVHLKTAATTKQRVTNVFLVCYIKEFRYIPFRKDVKYFRNLWNILQSNATNGKCLLKLKGK
jgi:hypothetical protein